LATGFQERQQRLNCCGMAILLRFKQHSRHLFAWSVPIPWTYFCTELGVNAQHWCNWMCHHPLFQIQNTVIYTLGEILQFVLWAQRIIVYWWERELLCYFAGASAHWRETAIIPDCGRACFYICLSSLSGVCKLTIPPTYPSKTSAFKDVAFLQILNLSEFCFSCRSEYGSEFEYDAPVSFSFNFPVAAPSTRRRETSATTSSVRTVVLVIF